MEAMGSLGFRLPLDAARQVDPDKSQNGAALGPAD